MLFRSLRDEVERQKLNKTSDIEKYEDFEFNAHFEYYIPKNYIADDISRLIIYRKLTNAQTPLDLKNILNEMYDRYGNYPPEVTNLLNLLKIKLKSISIGVIKINIQKKYIDLSFVKVNQEVSDILINMVEEKFIKMKGSNIIQIKNSENDDIFYTINLFYKKLGL